ncbi:site-specific integrase [Roseovarius ramblicola]|uniref:Tyrosine recombinase XerC n=1 Tax=Roseovarius ramblicola TaxID=2022336 RepID=A0ABV5I2P0_9RHOB
MKIFSPEDLSKALLPTGTPMFSDLIARIKADSSLDAIRKRDMVSGLQRVATALGMAPSNVPAAPQWLQPRLEVTSHAALNITQKSWKNLVSDARAALAHCGIVNNRRNQQKDLTPGWHALWENACKSGKVHSALGRFVHFLDRLGVQPDEVGDQHVKVFHEALVGDEIRKNPKASLRNAVNAWNRAVKHVPGWPQTRLQGLAPKVDKIKLPLESYPSSFAADLTRFKETAGQVSFFDESNKRPLAAGTIFAYSRVLERFAGGLVRADVPPERITDLGALLSEEMIETGLRWFYARYENQITPGLKEMILVLQQVSRRHLGRAEHPLLDKYAQRLPSKQPGLTAKNRARLRPMMVPAMTSQIIKLPELLIERAGQETTHKACLMRERAIALAILLYCPIRRGNLVSLDLDRHLQRPGDGKVYLVFPKDEVKNRQPLEFELPPQLVRMIERHISLRSPRLCPPGTPYLFPKRDGSRPMQAEQLADSLKLCLKRELGLDVNMHLFRHFAAHLLLKSAPGNYEAARRLLGHSRLSSTINAYTGIETTEVSRRYGEIIEGLKQ